MKSIKYFLFFILILISNLLFWTTSDIQQECVNKIENNNPLSLYEKLSIYQIHITICTLGYIVSPEAAKQQFYLTWKHGDIIWDNDYIKSKLKNKKGRITFKYSDLSNLRLSLALNGTTIKNDKVTVNFIYPKIKEDTNILGFKINEYLLNYLQEIGWLHSYKFTYLLK